MVAIIAFDETSRIDEVTELAILMDRRIDGVLSGEIVAAPVVTPTHTIRGNPMEIAVVAGYNLEAMLPTLEDLPDGAVLESEGFDLSTDAVAAYEREFGASGVVFELGGSQVAKFTGSVELTESAVDARGPVLIMKGVGPAVFGELVGAPFAEGAGFEAESLEFQALEISDVGDAFAGFLMKMETAIGDFDAHMLFFAVERISVQMIVMGPAQKLEVGDTLSLARLVEGKVIENSPGDSSGPPGVSGEQVPLMPLLFPPSNHIPVGEFFNDYNTIPPTSGPHWGPGWASCGIYKDESEVPNERIVHNMEHGQVVISHNLTDEAELGRLVELVREMPGLREWLILRPYSKLPPGEVVIHSWGWLARFDGVDPEGLTAFYRWHLDQAPESIPCL